MSQLYEELSEFLVHKMRMTHVYQPVMLGYLLTNGGAANVTEIAKVILSYDESQVEYYEEVTKRYPGTVLSRNHAIVEREKNSYRIKDFENLSESEIQDLVQFCSHKIAQFLKSKKIYPWDHRRNASGYISGSKRYEVLANAKNRCVLCGVSSEQRALEVDHIVPRALGGSDDISNLQALCYKCNSMKRHTDSTDFRDVSERYQDREAGCLYCSPTPESAIASNELVYAILSNESGTPMHTLIAPKRHVPDYFDLFQPERNAIQQILSERKNHLKQEDRSIQGFTVTFDAIREPHQTDSHCHMHLIPQRA